MISPGATGRVPRTSLRRVGARLERFLRLAAAPTFAAAGLWVAFDDRGATGAWCGTGTGGSHVAGMLAMYAMMALFHLAPWCRLFADRSPDR